MVWPLVETDQPFTMPLSAAVGVRPEHAQHSFDVIETMRCVSNQSRGAGNQSSMQIGETVAPHHKLAHWTACLQHAKSVKEAALVTVDFMRKTALRNFAGVIESLLRVARAVEQLLP